MGQGQEQWKGGLRPPDVQNKIKKLFTVKREIYQEFFLQPLSLEMSVIYEADIKEAGLRNTVFF